jgi:hypothetical protein
MVSYGCSGEPGADSGGRQGLALVTVRALLGIELVSRDAEDPIALDAYLVDVSLSRFGRRGSFGVAGNRGGRSFTHGRILPWYGSGIPAGIAGITTMQTTMEACREKE